MSDNYNSLKGFGVIPSEILFNEDGFSIQRQSYILYSNIAMSVLLISGSTAIIFSAVNKGVYNWFFYLQVIIVFMLLLFLVLVVFLLCKYRERNKKKYTYSEIRHIETRRKGVYVNLLIEFSDNSTDKIKLYWNTKSRDFITFLKTKVESSMH